MARPPQHLAEPFAALAASPLLARLDGGERQRLLACLVELEQSDPRLAAEVTTAVAAALGAEIAHVAGEMGLLLRGRSLPRADEILVRLAAEDAHYPDHVPPTSLIREFIGGSGFEY